MAIFNGSNGNDVADAGSGQLSGFTTGTLAELLDTTGDAINGMGGNDFIVAGAGNDIIDAGAASPGEGLGVDLVTGGEGNDVINVDAANAETTIIAYVLESGSAGITVDLSNDTATDTFGDTDTLNGAVFIVATNSNDTLIGDTTDDTLAPGRGTDFVDGGESGGNDHLAYYFISDGQGGGSDGFNFTSGITVNMTGEDAGTVTSTDGVNTTFINMEVIAGTRFADTFNGGTGADDFKGGEGNDIFKGGGGIDHVAYNQDYVGGGLTGATVNLATNTGTDPFGDTDTFNNIENVTGTQFADSLTGNNKANDLQGIGGNDLLDGGDGNDIIDGGDGGDMLIGAKGNDDLIGGAGEDDLLGGDGNDILNGGLGVNSLNGGKGKDLFVYLAMNDGNDIIQNYVVKDDTLQFSASGFGGGLVEGQGLISGQTFISNSNPTATTTAGTFLYDMDGQDLFWDEDGSDSGAAMHIAHFDSAVALQANDFDIIA